MRVRELNAGQEIDQVLMVRASEPRKLVLGDRTGTLEAAARTDVAPGMCVRVSGRVEARNRVQIDALRVAEPGEYALEDLLDGDAGTVERMEADLRELIATLQCRHLRALLDRIFGPATETWALFREAPAAKRYHQAYRHGLLEHSLTVAQSVSAISATFGGVDRDGQLGGEAG